MANPSFFLNSGLPINEESYSNSKTIIESNSYITEHKTIDKRFSLSSIALIVTAVVLLALAVVIGVLLALASQLELTSCGAIVGLIIGCSACINLTGVALVSLLINHKADKKQRYLEKSESSIDTKEKLYYLNKSAYMHSKKENLDLLIDLAKEEIVKIVNTAIDLEQQPSKDPNLKIMLDYIENGIYYKQYRNRIKTQTFRSEFMSELLKNPQNCDSLLNKYCTEIECIYEAIR